MDAAEGLRRALVAAAMLATAPAFAADPAPASPSSAPARAAAGQPALLPLQIARQRPPDSGRLKFRQGVAAAGCACHDSLSERDIARALSTDASDEGARR